MQRFCRDTAIGDFNPYITDPGLVKFYRCKVGLKKDGLQDFQLKSQTTAKTQISISFLLIGRIFLRI